MFNFTLGVLSGLAVIGAYKFILSIINIWKSQIDTWAEIEQFCKEHDYCVYGCGRGDEGYYGGYNCPSDHK